MPLVTLDRTLTAGGATLGRTMSTCWERRVLPYSKQGVLGTPADHEDQTHLPFSYRCVTDEVDKAIRRKLAEVEKFRNIRNRDERDVGEGAKRRRNLSRKSSIEMLPASSKASGATSPQHLDAVELTTDQTSVYAVT